MRKRKNNKTYTFSLEKGKEQEFVVAGNAFLSGRLMKKVQKSLLKACKMSSVRSMHKNSWQKKPFAKAISFIRRHHLATSTLWMPLHTSTIPMKNILLGSNISLIVHTRKKMKDLLKVYRWHSTAENLFSPSVRKAVCLNWPPFTGKWSKKQRKLRENRRDRREDMERPILRRKANWNYKNW